MQTKDRRRNIGIGLLCVSALALTIVVAAAGPAEAHHMMGGRTPSTFLDGLLSGLGHPVIGLDHLAFIVAIGIVAGVSGLSLGLPALFIAASAVGVAVHVRGLALPGAEMLVALSVLLAGGMIALGRSIQSWIWAALLILAGVVHGYAFGESIYGAEVSPLAAYLLGLVVVQAAIATGIALLARRAGTAAIQPRLAGAAIAGIGIAILAGQLLPG
jgi:urease accessory protein